MKRCLKSRLLSFVTLINIFCRLFPLICLYVFLYIYQGLLVKENVKWSQFSISDRLPPSSCEKTAVCFTALAVTYQQTYFRWLVLLSVIQFLEKIAENSWLLLNIRFTL
ncbi:hypothetical protein ILYODFUR_033752 [Ilyodon furcidens]|uniref:Uncharacterized protein n=1 Tax=Ilyodon furcidens TaxID=33524 RepID=A0ABV0UYD2_9TELE